jgi:hypothetical protein
MVAMTALGFGNTLEKTLSKLDKVLLNEGLLKVCGDAGWDKGDFNNDRVALARKGQYHYLYHIYNKNIRTYADAGNIYFA